MKRLKMFIKDLLFQVQFAPYSEKHYCKTFYKKYSVKQWLETKKTIEDTLTRAFMFQQSELIDLLNYSEEDDIGLFKLSFRVAGTNMSPKAAGNRVVFALCNKTTKIDILIVYSKDHCDKKHSETQWIYEQIKKNFPEFKQYCK